MKKIISRLLMLALLALPFSEVLPVQAAVIPGWNTTGNYVVSMNYLGTDYAHDMSLTQNGVGNLTGNGGSPAGANVYTWVVTSGTVAGNSVDLYADYTATADAVTPQTVLHLVGTVAVNGTMSGTWSDNYQAGVRSGTWVTTSGNALALGSISAEDFGVVNYNTGLGILKGYTAGFGLTDATFAGVQSVVVKLYAGGALLQTNTATAQVGIDITGAQISSPFDVFGTFNYVTDGYWTNVREAEYGQTIPATKVVATVTLANGKVVTAENTVLAGDTGDLSASNVSLGSSSSFMVLSKTGVTNTGSHTSMINGNVGSSPITSAAMNNVFCSEIVGTIYGVDAAYTGSGTTTCFAGNPPLSNKTLVDTAVLDMETAYTEIAGRTLPDGTELYAGNLGGQNFAPGLYKWSTDVTIPANVTLTGDADDVWIFQIAGNLNIASAGSIATGTKVILAGGAQASNVFWQIGGVTGATLGTYSTFNGNILTSKQIIIQTGAVLHGRALAQTQVTLDANTISLTVIIPPVILPTVKITIAKYLDGVKATAVTANNYSFPMSATWNAVNIGAGTGLYALGPVGFNTSNPYEAVTSDMTSNANYSTNEITSNIDVNSNVLPVGGICVAGKYRLLGYKTSSLSLADALTQTTTLVAPAFTGLTSSRYIVVLNEKCPTVVLGQISGMKYHDLNRNGKKDANEPGLAGWVIKLKLKSGSTLATTTTTDINGNYSFTNIAPGKYKIREISQKGWKRISKNPKTIVMTDGSVVTNVDFGSVIKHKKEKEDNDDDDNHDDQSGEYCANKGKSNYESDQNKKEHERNDDKKDKKDKSNH